MNTRTLRLKPGTGPAAPTGRHADHWITRLADYLIAALIAVLDQRFDRLTAHHDARGDRLAKQIAARFATLDATLAQIVKRQTRQTAQIGKLHMGLENMNAAIDAILASAKKIAADVAGLKKLIVPGMSQTDVDTVQGRLDTVANTLNALDAETPDAEEPPVDPPPTQRRAS